MADYVFNYRPEIVIHERLRNNGFARHLIALAEEKNYSLIFDNGILRKDRAFIFRNGFMPDDQYLNPSTGASFLENALVYSPEDLASG
jgi:hypothetical protein